MIKAMYSGISGMKANQSKLDVVGNNVANVGTTAFKKSSIRFNDSFYQTMLNSSAGTNTIGGTNASQIGTGVQIAAINKDMSQGGLQPTGRPSDLAVDGSGFFQVVRDGKVYYTRDGSFNLDTGSNPDAQSGRLVNSDGYILQGTITDEDGNQAIGDITIPLKAISKDPAPDGSVQDVVSYNISKDGTVELILSDGNRTNKIHDIPADLEAGDTPPAGMTTENGNTQKIDLYSFQNPVGLEAIGGNLYSASVNSGEPISGNNGVVVQGAIEMSNVDLAEEFTEMIVASRAFQASSKMVSTADEILQEIINLKR